MRHQLFKLWRELACAFRAVHASYLAAGLRRFGEQHVLLRPHHLQHVRRAARTQHQPAAPVQPSVASNVAIDRVTGWRCRATPSPVPAAMMTAKVAASFSLDGDAHDPIVLRMESDYLRRSPRRRRGSAPASRLVRPRGSRRSRSMSSTTMKSSSDLPMQRMYSRRQIMPILGVSSSAAAASLGHFVDLVGEEADRGLVAVEIDLDDDDARVDGGRALLACRTCAAGRRAARPGRAR